MIQHDFFAMASQCKVCLEGLDRDAAQNIAVLAEAEVMRIEWRFSRYRPESELSRINRAAEAGGAVAIDPEVESLLAYARLAFERSGGLFDPTSGLLRKAWDFKAGRTPDPAEIAAILPRIGFDKLQFGDGRLSFTASGMELDFGGFGKEYAADRAAEICREQGAEAGFVDLGGDIRVIGPHPGGAPWRFGIANPRAPEDAVAVVTLSDGALATSGDYERFFESDGRRFCHILDPRTGWPAEGARSVSVVAERALVAGTLATTAMLKGGGARDWLDSLALAYVLVDAEGTVTIRDMARPL